MKVVKWLAEKTTKHLVEVFIAILPAVAFFDLSLVSPFINRSLLPPSAVLGIILMNIYFFYLLILLLKRQFEIKLSPVLIPILMFVGIRLLFLDSIPKWDSSEYFQALIRTIHDYNFTFKSFLISFNWFGHITMGFAFITSISQLLKPSNLIVLNISNIALGVLAIFSFYKICEFISGQKKLTENIFVTTMFALNPLFIGVSMAFVADYGVLVFFLASIYALLYRKNILLLLFSIILVFTKETGAYAYAIFIFSYIVLTAPSVKRILILLTPFALILAYLIHIHWVLWSPDGNNVLTWGNTCRFCFGFKSYNIIKNLEIFFVLNFNWIMSSIIALALFKQIILKKLGRNIFILNEPKNFLYSVVITFVGFIALYSFFVVYIMPRYLVLGVPLLIIIFYFSLKSLFRSVRIRKMVMLFLAVLFLIETFTTIDPISKKIFGTLQIGGQEFLSIGTEYLGDGLIYNTQFIYSQRLIGKFIKDYKITSDNNIFIDPYAWGTFYSGWGFFQNTQPKIYFSLDNLKALPSEIYYLDFPLKYYTSGELTKLQYSYIAPVVDPKSILDKLQKSYKVIEVGKIRVDNYHVFVYKLQK